MWWWRWWWWWWWWLPKKLPSFIFVRLNSNLLSNSFGKEGLSTPSLSSHLTQWMTSIVIIPFYCNYLFVSPIRLKGLHWDLFIFKTTVSSRDPSISLVSNKCLLNKWTNEWRIEHYTTTSAWWLRKYKNEEENGREEKTGLLVWYFTCFTIMLWGMGCRSFCSEAEGTQVRMVK